MPIVVTKSPRGPEFLGRRKVVFATVTGDTSYPAGGSVFPAAGAFGLRKIESVTPMGGNDAAKGVNYYYDRVNNKLRVVQTGALDAVFNEAAAAANLATHLIDIQIIGT